MDKRVQECPGLTPADLACLRVVEAGLPITADVSRADILLCCRLSEKEALAARHLMPKSMSSLYRHDATGRILTPDDHPLLFRTLRQGSAGRGQKEVLGGGAPIIQEVFPVQNTDKHLIAALLVETNMIAYERHRRRNRAFRHAVRWLQEMCARGELEEMARLGRFGLYDGVYLVNRERSVVYMSGIAANLFRSIGIVSDLRHPHINSLEALDVDMVEQAFQTQHPAEVRRESEDGRIWIRKAIPLHPPPVTWQNYWQNWSWHGGVARGEHREVEAVLVLVHNATEAVQKQRELNVKSAIIQEVHHRVKNNLQTIAAILRIQARRTQSEEAKQQLTEAVNRILSMSVIHEFLSQDEHRAINVREVCQRIANQVAQVASNPDQAVEIKVGGPNIRLPAGQATPTAMVVNELLLNALEHGFSQRARGTVRVELSDLGDAVCIVVEDDGDGLPPDFDPAKSESLGLQIVHTLVTDDLKGQLVMESVWPPLVPDGEEPAPRDGLPSPCGTRATVTFPKRTLKVTF